MNKLFIRMFVTAMLSVSVCVSWAGVIASGNCGKDGDNLTWSLSDDYMLTILGSGEMEDYFDSSSPWYNYRNDIKSLALSGMTSIGNYAFSGCSSLTSVTIPSSVTSIGSSAFKGCIKLISISVDQENSIYDSRNDCNAIIETATNKLVFGFSSTIIPCTVTSIGDGAFSGCSQLTNIDIPLSVTSIGDDAFYECSGLTAVVIPRSVTRIGGRAFAGCKILQYIDIPESVSSLGSSVISGHGDSYYGETLGINVFVHWTEPLDCGILFSKYSNGDRYILYVPKGTSEAYLGSEPWKNCGDIIEMDYFDENTNLSRGSCGYGLTYELSEDYQLTISGRGSIMGYYINGDRDYYTIPRPWADYYEAIDKINIKEGVTAIGSSAFEGCCNLTSVLIPSSVTGIGENVFKGCSRLEQVYVDWEDPSTCHLASEMGGAFGCEISDAVLYVPKGTIQKYKSTDWKNFGTIIEQGSVAHGTCGAWNGDNLRWVLSEDGTLTITGSGQMEGMMTTYYEWRAPWYEYRTSIRYLELPDGLYNIGSDAFLNCTGIKNVTIPSGVRVIDSGAFYGCVGLNSIQIPTSVKSIELGAFASCRGLTVVSIPESVCEIGFLAFADCSGMTEITIPKSVTSISNQTFRDCTGLKNITVNWEEPLPFCFEDCDIANATLYVPKGTLATYRSAEGWKDFGTIVEQGTTVIASGTCGKEGGDNLHWSLSAEGLLLITGSGDMADYPDDVNAPWYEYRTDILYLQLPEGLTSIGMRSFTDCNKLTSVEIPEQVATIGDGAFWGCSGIMAIKIPEAVTQINDAVFYGCTNLMAVQLPESLTSVGEYAFMFCSGLTTLTLPATVTKLDNYSFYGCSGLTSVTFPEGVTTIGTAAFNSCTNLATITIPGSVTSLGQGAFASSQQLKEVYISRTKPLTYKNFFYGCDLKSATLYVPNGATAAYKAATGWKDFGTIIPLELDETGLRYDVDGDGAVDIADITTVVNYIKTHQDLEVKE